MKKTSTKSRKQVPASLLHEKRWAVIADHFVAMDLTHEEARQQATELKARKQRGVVIVTNEAAQRMVDSTAGVVASSLPDMKF